MISENKQILYISRCIPYDSIGHAGGKTLNYYIKRMAESGADITIVSTSEENEFKKNDCASFGIKVHRIVPNITAIALLIDKIYKLNIWGATCGIHRYSYIKAIKEELFSMSIEGYTPDIIVLEWTQSLFLLDVVKIFFPNAKYIASEHDIYFQGLCRKVENEHNQIKRIYRRIKYQNTRKKELLLLNACDTIFVQNHKDEEILLKNGIATKCVTISPYYDHYKINYNSRTKKMMIYGAMGREENYKSAIWFIKEVLPLIKEYDYKLYIVGSKPPRELINYSSDNIIITGFVNDVESYMENCSVGIVPLTLGAGIKVKVLEFAAAGIPVLTNKVGIEGINLNKNEFFFCETASDYANVLINVFNEKCNLDEVSTNCRNKINETFNLEKSFQTYSQSLIRF